MRTTDAHSIKSKELVAPTVLELHYIIKQVKPTIFENATLDRPRLPRRNARPLTEDQNNAVIEKFYDRIVGRYLQRAVEDPKTGEILVDGDTYVTEELAR